MSLDNKHETILKVIEKMSFRVKIYKMMNEADKELFVQSLINDNYDNISIKTKLFLQLTDEYHYGNVIQLVFEYTEKYPEWDRE